VLIEVMDEYQKIDRAEQVRDCSASPEVPLGSEPFYLPFSP
jgi:hypothetical protein